MSFVFNRTIPDDFDKTTAENFCRNPGSSKDKPFCFVEDETVYEKCDVPVCEPGEQNHSVVICRLKTESFVVIQLHCCNPGGNKNKAFLFVID